LPSHEWSGRYTTLQSNYKESCVSITQFNDFPLQQVPHSPSFSS
jgi:hypothetical protein